jgi:hypothetical protein
MYDYEYKTARINQPIYFAYEGDEVIFQTANQKNIYKMTRFEFDWLANEMFENWQRSNQKYIQILEEWNECKGCFDLDGITSDIKDIEDTIYALEIIALNKIKPDNFNLTTNELETLISFFRKNVSQIIQIYTS